VYFLRIRISHIRTRQHARPSNVQSGLQTATQPGETPHASLIKKEAEHTDHSFFGSSAPLFVA